MSGQDPSGRTTTKDMSMHTLNMVSVWLRLLGPTIGGLALVSGVHAQECGDHWLPALQTQIAGVQSGQGAFAACTFDPDDGGPLPRVLVVAGSLSVAGGEAVRNIAQWDGTEWSELGGGLNSTANTVVEFEGDLIVGGYFANAGGDGAADRVARWDGTNWSAMGTLPGLEVERLRVLGGELYAVANSSGNSSSTVHKWNGTSWDQIGNAIPNAFLLAIEKFNNQIYIGGVFQNADGDATADYIAFFNGATWQGVGGGLSGTVYDLRVHNSALYVGGQYDNAGGVAAADSIARWTGAAWQAVGTGLSSQCMALEVLNGDLVAGGSFGFVDSPPTANTNGVARFNGTNWVALGQGFSNQFAYSRALTLFNGELVAVGRVEFSGAEAFAGVAHFDGTKWLGFGGPGLGPVLAVAEYDGELIIGGEFVNAGGDPDADYIARWHNGHWASVGEAFNAPVRTLTVYLGELYAGGDFTNVGDPAQADYLAKWNGTDWEQVGPDPFDAPVNVLARFGSDVVIAGDFTVLSSNVLIWNGTTMTPQSSLGSIIAFAELDGKLYAGSGASQYAAARLDISGWTPLFSNAVNPCEGLGAFNGKIYFSTGAVNIDGVQGNDFCIAWNGTSWDPSGDSPPNSGPIVVYEGRLFAGSPPSELVNGEWQSPAFPSDSDVKAAGIVNGELVFGGDFARMGGQFSPYVARFKSGDAAADCDPEWAQAFSPLTKLNGGVFATHAWDHDADESTASRWLIGGAFYKQGTQPLARVAVWNDSNGLFDPLGAGFNGAVNAIYSFDHDLSEITPDVPVAAGAFSKTGVTKINKVAWWDGALWQPLGTGFNGTVYALALGDPDGGGPLGVSLIAGGSFTKSGTTVLNRVARWDVGSQSWQPLASGFNGAVRALAFYDTDGPGAASARLCAGGSFTKAGLTPVARLAWFDGAAWSAAGTGVNGTVYALCAADPDGNGIDALYVGGSFKKSGISPLSRIGRFNGTNLDAIGDGLDSTVYAIECADFDGCGPDAGAVLVGGTFKKSGVTPISRLATWDGAAWSAVGGGTNSTVRSLCAVTESVGDARVTGLLTAGDFKTVGVLPQKSVGLFVCPDVAPILAPRMVAPCNCADVAGEPGNGSGARPDGQITLDDALAFVQAVFDAEDADDGPSVEDSIEFVKAFAEGCP